MLTGGLGNTSFVGLPTIEAFHGKSGTATGILTDTLGSYLVLSTLGIGVACFYPRGAADARTVIRRVVTFPPLIAVALALVSVGMQLRLNAAHGQWKALAAGLGSKLVVAPLVSLVLYVAVLGLHGGDLRVTVLESAMGPQIGTVFAFVTLPCWWSVIAPFA